MKRLEIHPVNPQLRLVKHVVDVFEKGGLVVYPTGAGYSVGCDALNRKAVERIYRLKQNIKKYVMALMVMNFSSITEFAEVENWAFRYMKERLPGPYTFILPATKHGKKILDVKRPEIGIRMPDHPFFDVLHQVYRNPLLTTAAKIHDEDFFIEPDDIENKFGKQVDLIVDSGPIPINPTTVISLVSGEAEILREGGAN